MSKIDDIYNKFAVDLNMPGVYKDDIDSMTVVGFDAYAENLSYTITFISNNNPKAEDISLYVFNLVTLDESKYEKSIEFVNEMNKKFKLLKFMSEKINNEYKISIKYDFAVTDKNIVENCADIAGRVYAVVKAIYPNLMKLKWA